MRSAGAEMTASRCQSRTGCHWSPLPSIPSADESPPVTLRSRAVGVCAPRPMASSSRIIDLTDDSPPLPAVEVDPLPGRVRGAAASIPDDHGDQNSTGFHGQESGVAFLGVSRPGAVAVPSREGRAGSRTGAAVGEGSSRGFMSEQPFRLDAARLPLTFSVPSDEISEAARSGAFRPRSPPWTRSNRPSAITIHDSPPLRTRSNPAPPPPPGSIASNRNRAAGAGGVFRENGGRFSGIIVGAQAFGAQAWNALTRGASGRGSAGDRVILGWAGPGRRGGRRDHASDLFDPNGLQDPEWAALYPILHQDAEDPPGTEHPYRVADSHPFHQRPGFAKDIIPPDREVLTLDPATQTLRAEREDLRPTCAACERELLMGQDGPSGRRPWILACSHVVDFRCLDGARQRAKAERSQTRSARGRGARGGRARRSPAKTPGGPVRGRSAPTPIDLSASPDRNLYGTGKGKGAADVREEGISAEASGPRPDAAAAVSRAAQAAAGKKRAESVIQSWWTVCPVPDCDGEHGDVLARKGTRLSPWEMFV